MINKRAAKLALMWGGGLMLVFDAGFVVISLWSEVLNLGVVPIDVWSAERGGYTFGAAFITLIVGVAMLGIGSDL